MSYSVMFALLLLTPLLFSLLCFACRKRGLSATCTVTVLHSLGITLLLILALWVVQTAADAGEIFAAGLWLHIDGLGGLFLAILGVIGFLTGVYSIGYMRHEVAHGELSPVTLCDYYGFFHRHRLFPHAEKLHKAGIKTNEMAGEAKVKQMTV